jgi:cytoskeleton protein RodZ
LASSFGIGAPLRQARLAQGRALDAISAETRIATRFLEAIEADDFERLPGLIFTRNFVRQYALALKLDPDPLLAGLPKHDESTIQLPNPPARVRSSYGSSYHRDKRWQSLLSSTVWLLIAGSAGAAAYIHFNHSARIPVSPPAPVANTPLATSPVPAAIVQNAVQKPEREPAAPDTPNYPVQVVLTAHEPAWVQVSADGKAAFTGTLQSNERREIAAAEQVKISTGNAGALTISLNGKTLDSLGTLGQVRVVKLTAEGPEFPKAPPPPPDPL